MLTLYAWNTPNGQKPAILLEELGLDYELKLVNIGKGEQFLEEFVAINPNSKIPALLHDGGAEGAPFRIFESGAILVQLALEHGRFLPAAPAEQAEVLSWTFWQVGGVGPMLGQWGYFMRAEEKLPAAIARYQTETLRLLDVLERQLAARSYVSGESYTIADMALWPWVSGGLGYLRGAGVSELPALPHTERWVAQIGEREAVKRAMAKLKVS